MSLKEGNGFGVYDTWESCWRKEHMWHYLSNNNNSYMRCNWCHKGSKEWKGQARLTTKSGYSARHKVAFWNDSTISIDFKNDFVRQFQTHFHFVNVEYYAKNEIFYTAIYPLSMWIILRDRLKLKRWFTTGF